MPLASEYDGIIIGAGHNGLVLQAYLARAGLSTLLLERSLHVGGGLSTLEDNAHPGLRDRFQPVVEEVISPLLAAPPLPPQEQRALLQGSQSGRRFLQAAAL